LKKRFGVALEYFQGKTGRRSAKVSPAETLISKYWNAIRSDFASRHKPTGKNPISVTMPKCCASAEDRSAPATESTVRGVDRGALFIRAPIECTLRHTLRLPAAGLQGPPAADQRQSRTPVSLCGTHLLNGRTFTSLEHLNETTAWWLEHVADVRVHRETKKTPRAAHEEELPHLLTLPEHACDTARVVYRVVNVEGLVSYQNNGCSVPWRLIG